MDGFSILRDDTWRADGYRSTREYGIGQAFGCLYRGNKQASVPATLVGRLYLAKSGWLLLSVPNALLRGLFDALPATGAQLPTCGVMNVPHEAPDLVNAHISVMTADEVNKIGADKITERGRMFAYALGRLEEIDVKNVAGVSKIWALLVKSPQLTALRKSYGLSPRLNDRAFHITVAARRAGVLQDNPVSKAAADTKLSRSGDLLPGGAADNVPDREFSPAALAEGVKHEHEHTNNDQIAKEIAKDHLREDETYYEKAKKIEKQAWGQPSVYLQQFKHPAAWKNLLRYDHTKPVFQNIHNQLSAIKARGDFLMQAQRNQHHYMAALNPAYRYQRAMQAIRGELQQPPFVDQLVENYGTAALNTAFGVPRS